MNFKPYHLLIQLIPGVLVFGTIVLGNTQFLKEDLDLQFEILLLFKLTFSINC